MWDEDGPVRHVVALALHEIGHAATRPISVPACKDVRLRRVIEALLADPSDPRTLDAFAEMAGASARTLARLFRRETGMSFQAWRRQLRLTEGLAALSEGDPGARGCGGRVQQRPGIRGGVPLDIRHHTGSISSRELKIPGANPECGGDTASARQEP